MASWPSHLTAGGSEAGCPSPPPVWSPDGTRLAFAAPVGGRAPEDGDPASAPVVIDRLDHIVDGQGWIRDVRSQVHALDVASGACHELTDGPDPTVRPSWSPAGDHPGMARSERSP